MKKNIKFSKHPLPVSFLHPYVIPAKAGIHLFLSLRAPLWVRGNFVKCHCELSKKVWQSHYSFISFIFFAFVLFLPTLMACIITVRYSYALICIFLITTNLFPLYLCYSCSLYVIPAKAGIHLFLSLRAPLWVRGNLVKCHCELSKKVWQSHYSFIFQYFTFFRHKFYKKTIFFINIFYIYY